MSSDGEIYYSVAAQHDNLGDVEIRGRVLEWISPQPGRVRIYAGTMPDAYVEALPVPHGVTVFRSRRDFLASWFAACRRRRGILVLPPGPRFCTWRPGSTKAAAQQWAMSALTNHFSGPVASVGGSVGGQSGSPSALLYRSGARHLAHHSVRDRPSRQFFGGHADLIPDVAFAGAPLDPVPPGDPRFIISLRDPEGVFGSSRELSALLGQARRAGIRPVIVTQVHRDEGGHRRLGEVFGVPVVGWPADRRHRAQMELLNAEYRNAAVVLTDRLHVAILAGRHGAGIIDAVGTPSAKVTRTLAHVLPRVRTPHEAVRIGVTAIAGERAVNLDAVEQAVLRLTIERERLSRMLFPATLSSIPGSARPDTAPSSSPGKPRR